MEDFMKKFTFLVIIVNIAFSFISCATKTGNNQIATGKNNQNKTILEAELATHYIEFMGISKTDLEKLINSVPIRVVNEMNTYQIIPGNNDATNLISFFIDPIKGVYRIVSMHEYSNIWVINKVNEYTKIFGEPDVRDDNYAFTVKENENGKIIVLVTSNVVANKQYGIIITMLLE
jgi:hypothetical protein